MGLEDRWRIFWKTRDVEGDAVPEFRTTKEADWCEDLVEFYKQYWIKYPPGQPYDDYNNYGDNFERDV